MNYPRIDRPTEPGFYWFREREDRWRSVEVFDFCGALWVSGTREPRSRNLAMIAHLGEWLVNPEPTETPCTT